MRLGSSVVAAPDGIGMVAPGVVEGMAMGAVATVVAADAAAAEAGADDGTVLPHAPTRTTMATAAPTIPRLT